MSVKECIGCCGACAVCTAWVCWCVFGGFALSNAFGAAKECDGWLLWVATLLSIIYVPFGLLMSGFPCMVACEDRDAAPRDDAGVVEGCLKGCILMFANIFNTLFLILDGYAIWTEHCMASGLTVFVFAKVSFALCAVAMATSVGVTLLAHCCRV